MQRRHMLIGAGAAAISGVAAGVSELRRDAPQGAATKVSAGFNVIPNVPVVTHDGESMRFYDDLSRIASSP